MSLLACFLVLIGGFLGGVGRYFLSGLVGRWIGETFPWGTLVVNVTGAFLLGGFAAASQRTDGGLSSDLLWDFAVVGLLGGYTTVSSFSLQTINLALDGELVQAAFNTVASAGFCLLSVGTGYWLALWALG